MSNWPDRPLPSIYDVKAVANDIEVKPMTRTDPEIARDVLEVLKRDLRVPDESAQGWHPKWLRDAGWKCGVALST
jgi:hypothetical protein